MNFATRQQTKEATEAIRSLQSEGGKRGNCKRHHGETCWRGGKCSREVA